MTASTRAPTAATPGPTSVCKAPSISRVFSSIRAITITSSSRRWATCSPIAKPRHVRHRGRRQNVEADAVRRAGKRRAPISAMDRAKSKRDLRRYLEVSAPSLDVLSGGAEDGLYRSTDGGKTWTKLDRTRTPCSAYRTHRHCGRAERRQSRVRVDRIDSAGILWRSDDGGNNWTMVSDGSLVDARPFYFTHVAVDPKNPRQSLWMSFQLWRAPTAARSSTRSPTRCTSITTRSGSPNDSYAHHRR